MYVRVRELPAARGGGGDRHAHALPAVEIIALRRRVIHADPACEVFGHEHRGRGRDRCGDEAGGPGRRPLGELRNGGPGPVGCVSPAGPRRRSWPTTWTWGIASKVPPPLRDGGGPIEGARKSRRRSVSGEFPSPKGDGPIEGEQMQKPRTGGRTRGLSLAAGTSQAPQLVAPEANIRRDDHRGLHDARRRFNLAKSHGAR